MTSASLLAVPLVIAMLAIAAYLFAVIDELVRARVVGTHLPLSAAVCGPARQSALLLVTRTSTTERPDGQAWVLAPVLVASMAAAAAAAVPITQGIAAADVDDGIVLVGAAFAVVMVGVFLHGWSSNSPMPLVGGYRFIALALSYEMPLALVLIAAALPAESLSVGTIVASQSAVWNVVRQPLGLPLYLVAGLGLASWGPLNMADGADIAGGTAVEASGPARLAWEVARRLVLVAVAVVGAAVFLGGWNGPLLPGVVWMLLKVLTLLLVLSAAGHTVARVRLERFVVVAWTVLIPLALVDVFVSGALAL